MLAASLLVAFFAYGIPLWYQLHGQKILIVTSGSMAAQTDTDRAPDQFNAGDAVIITPISPHELRVGQVVTFWNLGHTRLTTHRIVDLVSQVDRVQVNDELSVPKLGADGGPVMGQYILTKGDANGDVIDADLTPIGNVRGAVSDVKPGWGSLLAYAHSAMGRLLVFAPALILLLGSELLSWRRRPARVPVPNRRAPLETHDALATPA